MTTEPPLPLHEWLAIPAGVRGDSVEVTRLAVCHGDGGVIPGCRAWPMAKWRPWGLTPVRVNALVSVGLCEWIGENSQDLFLRFFDKTFEDAWKKSSEMAAEGPKNRGKSGRPPLRPPSTEGDRRSETEIPEREKEGREDGSGAPARPPGASLSGTGTDGADSDLDTAIAAIRKGHRTAKDPDGRGIETGDPPLAAADLKAHGRELAGFVRNNTPLLLEQIARHFYRRDGKKPADNYWRESGWTLHLLVTQGIPALEGIVRERLSGRIQPRTPPTPTRDGRWGWGEPCKFTESGEIDLATGKVKMPPPPPDIAPAALLAEQIEQLRREREDRARKSEERAGVAIEELRARVAAQSKGAS